MVAIERVHFDKLSGHMGSKPFFNMHLRKPCIVQKQRTLKYLNILKSLSPTRIVGHIGGIGIDIEYELIVQKDQTAAFHITRHSVVSKKKTSFEAALEILQKEKDRILNRIETDIGGNEHFPQRSAGQYYVMRSGSSTGTVTKSHVEAISSGILPHAFGTNVVNWGFKIIKGQPKIKVLKQAV